MNLRILLAGFPVFLAFSGCAFIERQRFLNEEYRIDKFDLPFQPKDFKVIDRRPNVAGKDLKVPVLVLSRKDNVSPPLTQEHISLLKDELAYYFRGKKPVDSVIEIVAAEKQYQAGWRGERETATCKVKVTLSDPGEGSPFIYAVGESAYFIQSMIASSSSSEKLYQKCLRAAVYQASKLLASELGSDGR